MRILFEWLNKWKWEMLVYNIVTKHWFLNVSKRKEFFVFSCKKPNEICQLLPTPVWKGFNKVKVNLILSRDLLTTLITLEGPKPMKISRLRMYSRKLTNNALITNSSAVAEWAFVTWLCGIFHVHRNLSAILSRTWRQVLSV